MKFDLKAKIMIILFLIFLAGIITYKLFSGVILIASLFVFGAFSLIWKEEHIKIMGLGIIIVLTIANILINGLQFGIEFTGGTRIPIILDESVDQETMTELTTLIKKRASILGLTQTRVRAIGDSEINIEIASENKEQIELIEDTIAKQGIYLGVVDGKVAINGEDIYSQSVQPSQAQTLGQGADWGVSFSVTKKGAEQFAQTVKGKADFPIYMFLDRPTDAAIFVTMEDLKENTKQSDAQIIKAVTDALKLDEGRDIEIYIIGKDKNYTPKTTKTKAIISKDASLQLKNGLKQKGFVLEEKEDLSPTYLETQGRDFAISGWEAVGLLDTRYLAASITEGIPNYNYQITGTADQTESIRSEQKRIETILKGGSLPVQISIGGKTVLPATLGAEIQKYSIIGMVMALVAISIFIGIRYRNLKLIIPIIGISVSELIILLAILGAFTIDLPAMAGIIAAIGVGVDAQVVITDELLKKDNLKLHDKLAHAFSIIKTNVIVAIVAMIPLLFSDLVEVIAFAIAAILGALLGYLITRPAYAILAERILGIVEDKV